MRAFPSDVGFLALPAVVLVRVQELCHGPPRNTQRRRHTYGAAAGALGVAVATAAGAGNATAALPSVPLFCSEAVLPTDAGAGTTVDGGSGAGKPGRPF
jgi:hypothetical protein